MDDLNAFFIVGAPRTGTTAMARYLRSHPDICFSDPKETHYFLFADPGARPEELRKRFISAFFPSLSEASRMLGEGAVSTLYSVDAVQRILAAFPEAKFILMFRDPVDLLVSYHARLLLVRQEYEEDFETAWNLQAARAGGQNIPRGCSEPRLLQYREVARLGHYSAQLIAVAGQEKCKGIFLEDLSTDPLRVYKDVLEFLELPYDGRVSFKRKNQKQHFRSRFLQDLYFGPLLRPVANRLMKDPVRVAAIQRTLRPLRKRIKRINAVETTLPPLDPGFEARLRQEYRGDIELLGEIFGRDLRHWMEGPQREAVGTSQLSA